MKKKLIYNYWLIIIAWCMFLNDLTLLATLLGLGGIALLMTINRRINYWRLSFLSVILYVTISTFLSMSNIPYFFEKLYIFLAVICLDAAFTFERLYLFKNKYIVPFLVIMLISLCVLSIVAFALPSDLYTLFTKTSLYILILIIFLPHMTALSVCFVYKYVKNAVLSKKYLAMFKQTI